MRLEIDFWKAVEQYRAYVEKIVTATHTENEREKKLTLESFAIWLRSEWPRFVEVTKE